MGAASVTWHGLGRDAKLDQTGPCKKHVNQVGWSASMASVWLTREAMVMTMLVNVWKDTQGKTAPSPVETVILLALSPAKVASATASHLWASASVARAHACATLSIQSTVTQ